MKPPQSKTNASDESDASFSDLAVGEQIRRLRLARGLSLKELSERAGVSIGFLSQTERGKSSASVKVLTAMADALSVTLGDFFVHHGSDGQKRHQIVTRAGERSMLCHAAPGLDKELLTTCGESRGLDLFLMKFEPGGGTGPTPYAHQGIEAGLVLAGGLELEVDEVVHLLGEGDTCRFESVRPHSMRNAGQRPATVLWVNYRALPKPEPSEGSATDDPEFADNDPKEDV